MIGKEDLSKRGIEAGRTDVDKHGVVDTVKRELRGLYPTVSGYRERAKQLIEGAIVASLTIPSGIGVLAGQSSVAVAYALVLTVLLATVKLVDLSQTVWYLDDMSSRVGGFLSGGALLTGVIASAGFASPTVALVQSVAVVWAVIWLIAMYVTTIKGMLRMPVR
jgi:hypothetical protein